MDKKVTSTTALVDCLVDNNRFATRKLTADQLGAENFRNWKDLLADLHRVAYMTYADCENNDLTTDSPNIDLTPVFNALRVVLAQLGEVNGHKISANAELATLIIGYSGKRGNVDSPELQLCLSKIRNRQQELEKYENTNGVNPEAIESLKAELEKLQDEKAELLASPDNRIKKPTRSSADAFRLEVEHRLARLIADQKARSWEELEAEAEAKRQARRAKTAAKKKAAKKDAKANA